MGTVAKSSITLTSISDAYSVALSPSVCVIHADYDGTNPILTNAYTLISVYCGEMKVPFSIEMVSASHISIASKISKIDDYTYKLAITGLHYTLLEGGLDITVNANNFTTLTGRFLFTVERESTMLDWIQAWENNKTTIGSDSIITPRLFVGKKITGSYESLDQVPGLTGVYIGPSANDSCGVYGYKDSIEIFHLDETGGKIGGWNILKGGLYTDNGRLKILSTGAIRAVNDENDVIWEVREDGYASFAMENVRFYPNGDAEFTGKITANEGRIAGWYIDEGNLYNIQVGLSSIYKYVAIANIASIPTEKNGAWSGNHLSWVKAHGGVAMYYASSNNYGFIGYKGSSLVFSSGSTNYIAGWNFDESAIWIGNKNNNPGQYTDAAGSLTIGTNGLRGNSWYIDKDGTASFVKGLVKFGLTSGTIVGWTLTTNKIATDNIALVSVAGSTGLYLTASADGKFIERGPDAMENFINMYGGLYLNIKSGSAEFVARDSGGNLLFNLSSHNTSTISGWTLGTQRLSTKHIALVSVDGVTGLYMSSSTDVNLNTLSTANLSSTINSKGGIYLRTTDAAAEFVARDSGGNLLFNLSNTGESHIAGWTFNKTSLYTGSLVTSGNAASGNISIGPEGLRGYKWRFENDGSGAIAGNNITWDKYGNIKFAPNVSMLWETGINVAQMIAFGQMLYRDPEFTKDKKNGTGLYHNNYINYATFSAGSLLNTLQKFGLFLKGTGIVTRVDIVSNTGSVATVWTGRQALSDNSVEILSARTIDSTSTIRITFLEEDASILVGAASDTGITAWVPITSIGNGQVIVQTSRVQVTDTTAPNSIQKAIKYTCTRWNNVGDYRLGGFAFTNQSRANAQFVVKIVAKIPVGWVIENYHNAYGNGASTQWATSQEGTGKYEEYICIVKCGSSGTFQTINHFALKCNAAYTPVEATDMYALDIKRTNVETGVVETLPNVIWYVAYATVFDATSSDKVTTTIDAHGIYTGTLRADQIVAGTIDATKISADVILSNGNAWALNKDGSGYLANKNINWTKEGSITVNGKIIATSGSIAGFQISSGHIGVESSSDSESGGSDWSSLSIYKDFFKVGGNKGYVMFGNDVIPSSAGGAFTAVGRIVNNAPNTQGSYGFDQANYGLFINVSGGTKNYGISSNAALMAPSFINTKAQLLTFASGKNYTVDFSQNNIILMYYNDPKFSGTEVTLPTESSVAYKFGLSSLPNDFATVVIFRVRTGSLPITLKGIYNHNEDLVDYKMDDGDSVMVLITKCDGFRYQILNYTS